MSKPLPMLQQPSQKALNICILRLSAIGDVCHAVATVQAIQAFYPQAKITWVIGKIELQLLQGLPGVDFVVFDKALGRKAYGDLSRKLKAHLQGKEKAQAGKVNRENKKFRGNKKFDYLLHMQVAFRANLAALFIPAKYKVGFDNARSKELHRLFVRHQVAPQDNAHVLEGFAAFARFLGVPFYPEKSPANKLNLKSTIPQHAIRQPSWQMPLSAADIAWAKETIAANTATRSDTSSKPGRSNSILVLAPAASKAERNWLPERYAKLADYALSLGFTVFICGGPSAQEQQLKTQILAAAAKSNQLIDLVGKTSLKQLLALIQQASLVVSPDTGPAHMAVTVGTPVLGLYAHSNPERTGPYLFLPYVVEAYHQSLADQTGKTAAEQKFGKRAKGADLMASISFESVKTMFDSLIKNPLNESSK